MIIPIEISERQLYDFIEQITTLTGLVPTQKQAIDLLQTNLSLLQEVIESFGELEQRDRTLNVICRIFHLQHDWLEDVEPADMHEFLNELHDRARAAGWSVRGD